MNVAHKQILVVDDEPPMRSLLTDFLTSQGYLVTCAASGEAALQSLETLNSLAAVISDIRMTPLDGLELLKQIKTTHPALPVLLFTAAGNSYEKHQALVLGAFDYLHKPFSLTEMLRLIELAISRR